MDPAARSSTGLAGVSAFEYRMHLPPQPLFTDDDLRSTARPRWRPDSGRSTPRIRTEIVPRTTHALSPEEPDLVTARILDAAADDRDHTEPGENTRW